MTKKKQCEVYAVILTLLLILMPIRVFATEPENDCELKVSQLYVDEESGQYRFDICVRSDELFAGTDIGVFCSQDTRILSVENDSASSVGPTEANGLVWFGCFDGKNTLSEAVFTVSGTIDPMRESAVKITDVKLYRIDDGQYVTVLIEDQITIELRADNTDFLTDVDVPETEESNKTGYIVESLAFLTVVVLAMIARIYKTKIKRRDSIEKP